MNIITAIVHVHYRKPHLARTMHSLLAIMSSKRKTRRNKKLRQTKPKMLLVHKTLSKVNSIDAKS